MQEMRIYCRSKQRRACAPALLITTIWVLGLLSVAITASAQVSFRTVLLPDDHWPPINYHLTRTGSVVWRGAISDTTVTVGIFREIGGSIFELHRVGAPVPGQPGVTFGALEDWIFKAGRLVIITDLDGVPSHLDQALWISNPGGIEAVVTEGDPAPGLVDITFGDLTVPRVNRRGTVCFASRLKGPSITTDTDDSLWCGLPGDLELILREGDQAPDRPPGEVFTGLEPNPSAHNVVVAPFALDDDNRVHITAQVAAGRGIWRADAAGGTVLAFEGEPSPGTGLLYFDLEWSVATVGGSAGVAFDARLDSMAILGAFAGIGGGNARRVAATSDAAPGGGSFLYPIVLGTNAWSQALLRSDIAGAPDGAPMAIFAEVGGTDPLTRLVAVGEPAPGADPGDLFQDFPSGTSMYNASQQAMFMADIGSSPGSSHDSVWYWDPDHGAVLAAQVGGTVEVAMGDVRTINTLSMLTGGLHDGWRSSYSELGHVVVSVSFTDGSRAFLEIRLKPHTVVFDDGFESGDLGGWS